VRTFAHGGGTRREIPFDAIEPHVVTGCVVSDKNAFIFVDHVDSAGQLLYPVDKLFVHANVPLQNMVSYLPVKMILKIARLHNVTIGSHVSKSEFAHYFEGHDCVSCNLYLSVFSVVDSKSVKARDRMRAVRLNLNKPISKHELLHDFTSKPVHKIVSDTATLQSQPTDVLENRTQQTFSNDPIFEPTEFPPNPPDDRLSHKIITGFCAKSTRLSIEEAGCAACGRLVPTSQLSRLKAVKNLLPVLQVPNVTRVERSKTSQPIREYKGPVLDFTCNRICDECRQYLRNGKVPPHALANGLWLGAVPEELSCLGFVEKLLVARVRINGCFVRVASSGLRKMASHVIAFESPVPKVYSLHPWKI
jgi:ribosomal protein S26